jgi:hypothetical protein
MLTTFYFGLQRDGETPLGDEDVGGRWLLHENERNTNMKIWTGRSLFGTGSNDMFF